MVEKREEEKSAGHMWFEVARHIVTDEGLKLLSMLNGRVRGHAIAIEKTVDSYRDEMKEREIERQKLVAQIAEGRSFVFTVMDAVGLRRGEVTSDQTGLPNQNEIRLHLERLKAQRDNFVEILKVSDANRDRQDVVQRMKASEAQLAEVTKRFLAACEERDEAERQRARLSDELKTRNNTYNLLAQENADLEAQIHAFMQSAIPAPAPVDPTPISPEPVPVVSF